jgi:hypothetical protein
MLPFVPSTAPNESFVAGIAIALMILPVIAAILIVFIVRRKHPRDNFETTLLQWGMSAFLGGIACAVVVGLISTTMTWRADNEASEAFCTSAEDLYDIDLDGRCPSLYYPADRPEEDFKVYGTTTFNERTGKGAFSETVVHLVWDTDGFYLATKEDGAPQYEALPAR